MHVIGTAGHVDHGKSALVHALTGIDPDRLREEKERGLTIDLGFAWLTLPSGREASIVDVPGHERFIKNMLAGAGGIDLALLVVAADEGPMPQTREHLAILDLLDVPAGIVAITKCDLADAAYLDLVEAELDELLDGTRLAGAPKLRVSATTGQGLDALREALDAALAATPPKRDLGRPRLPIDRAFTIQGFGTVVTGTLVDGALEVGQEVELQPGAARARIRGLQRHKTKVARLEPGTRAAVNLSGVRAEDVRRGMVLALPGAIAPARTVDVRLRAATGLVHPLAQDAGVTFFTATAESEARVRFLDCDRLEAGREAWAQLVLDEPVAVVAGDHCIVRTTNDTVAGGVIVAVNPRRHRRNDPAVLDALNRQLEGTPAARLAELLADGPLASREAASRLRLEPAEAAAALAEGIASGQLVAVGETVVAASWIERSTGRALRVIDETLAARPLRPSVPRETVRSALRLDQASFDLLLAAAGPRIEQLAGGGLVRPGYAPRLSVAQQREADAYLQRLVDGGYAPPTDHLPAPDLIACLAGAGLVEDAGGGVVFAAAIYRDMVDRVTRHLERNGSITLAEVRDLFGNSRKYAQALLEHMDERKVTRRTGDRHTLRAPVEAVR